jgi:hypothetical protein
MTLAIDSPSASSLSTLGDQPFSLDGPDLAPVRDAIRRAGYTSEAVDELLGMPSTSGLTCLQAETCIRRALGDDPLTSLVRLFRLGQLVPAGAVESAFAPVRLETLAAAGLIKATDGGARSPFDLNEIEGLYLFSDRRPDQNDLPADIVMGVAGSSRLTAALTIRKQVAAALDLGTGCGVHALLAARHAHRVVATDFNRRALNMTAFNCRLNDLANVECRHGSWLEPVQGQKFDLIISNPPFVISPAARYLFRDSGLARDTACEQLLRDLPSFLTEGGLAQVLCNWISDPDGAWTDSPKRWLKGSDCNVLALHLITEDPLRYSTRWLGPQDSSQPSGFGAGLDAWLEYFRRHGVKTITTGSLVCQRHSGLARWFHPYRVSEHTLESLGSHLARLVAANNLVSGLIFNQDALLTHKLRPAGDFVVEQLYRCAEGSPTPTDAELCLRQGFLFRVPIDPAGLDLLSRCNGQQTLGDAVRDLAAESKADADALSQEAIALFRTLLLLGFVVSEGQPT